MEQVARLRVVAGTDQDAGPPDVAHTEVSRADVAGADVTGADVAGADVTRAAVARAAAADAAEQHDGAGDEDGLWHVSVTYAGPAVAPDELAAALRHLADERPFLGSARYAADRVELRYWDEAAELQDAAALALRLFMDHRRTTGLPDWRVVALEVVDRATLRAGGRREEPSPAYGLDDVRPMS